MDQAKIDALTYANLNKLSVGFLSIVVPLSSGLAGCLTYQFINYLNTKMFIQTQAQNQSHNHAHKQTSTFHSPYQQSQQFQEKYKNGQYDDRNHDGIKGEVVVGQLANQKVEELDLKSRNLPDHSSTSNSNYHPDFFDIRVDQNYDHSRHKQNWFSRLNIFHQQFEFLNDTFNVVVVLILIANLFSLALEILVFKSLAHHTLVDAGLTQVYSWQLSNLLIVNYLISTGIRVYFARLASTMLRAPKMFLICSLILLLISLGGLIFQSVLVGAHLINYDQIPVLFTRSGSVDQTLDNVKDLGDYLRLIGIQRIRLDLLQLAWLGPPFAWDLLISAVLMFNVLDSRKRCRFGSTDGSISLGIMVMLETMFLVTLVTFMVLCICLVLGGKVALGFERMNALYAGFDGFVTKLHTISIFCSLQHKVNDRWRLEQKLILGSQKTRDSAVSGYGLGNSVGSGDPNYRKRQSTKKATQTIQFSDLSETELEVSEEDGNHMVEDSEDVDSDADNADDEMEEENISVHAAENVRVNSLVSATGNRHSNLSEKQFEPSGFDVENLNINFPEQAKIINHHHVAITPCANEGLVSGPVVEAPIRSQSNFSSQDIRRPAGTARYAPLPHTASALKSHQL